MTDAEALAKALEPFVNASIDVTGSAVILGYPEAQAAKENARSALAAYRSRPAAEVVVSAYGEFTPITVGCSTATPALAGTEPAGEVVEAARAVIEQKFSTYKARNGREVGIQDENGEKCWIVPFDEMFALESALRDQSEA